MKILPIVILILCASVPGWAQTTAAPETKVFENDDLKFSYPADWTITDKSANGLQEVRLTKKDKVIMIAFISPLDIVESEAQFSRLRASTSDDILKNLKTTFTAAGKLVAESSPCIDLNTRRIPGKKLTGTLGDQPGTGELYTFVLGKRLLNLVYVRADRDKDIANETWNGIIKTLSLRNSDSSSWLAEKGLDYLDKGVVNGSAIRLGKPVFSGTEMDFLVQESIAVDVLIDETGKVIKAEANSGNKTLRAVSIQAAKNSLFKPVLVCEKPVKIKGTIIYNYQLR